MKLPLKKEDIVPQPAAPADDAEADKRGLKRKAEEETAREMPAADSPAAKIQVITSAESLVADTTAKNEPESEAVAAEVKRVKLE